MAVPADPGLRALRIKYNQTCEGSEIRHACMGIFFFFWEGWGVNLWSRLVLLEALGLRGGFDFHPYSIIPVT